MTGERDERPWGSYEVLEDAPTHKVKRIEVHPGRRLSYQRHEHRAEHWFVVSGSAGEYFGEEDIERLEDDFGRVS